MYQNIQNFRKSNIFNTYQSNNDIMKSQIALVGEVHTWADGTKHRKTLDGWVDVVSTSSKKVMVYSDEKFSELSKEIKGYVHLKQIEQAGGYIKTNETIIDKDYEPDDAEYTRTKAYKVKYRVNWQDAESSSNPDVKVFDSIDDAYEHAQKEGSWWNGGTDHFNEVRLSFEEVWLASDNQEYENEEELAMGDLPNDALKFVNEKIGINEDSLYQKDFGKRDSNSRDLENEAYHSLGGDLEGTYKADNGKEYKLEHTGNRKYSRINVLNSNDEIIGNVQLRIANHTYNPNNNDDSARSGNFISIEIANVNATKDKFHTSYSLQFDGVDKYEDVLGKTNERLHEILDKWDFDKLDKQ